VSDYWPLVTGGKPIASWVPYTIIGFEVMVLIGSLSTVAGLFINARIPRITQTVGYDPRFSDGAFGIWVECRPDEQEIVRRVLLEKGAEEVRGDR
jgi:molybdopterin-containing oxidoreductase family membrane subunit